MSGSIVRMMSGVVFALMVSACGSSGDESATSEMLLTTMPDLNAVSEVPLDSSQTGMFQQSNSQPIGSGNNVDASVLELDGVLIPAIFATQTDVDLAYAQSGAALVAQLNESLLLPADINVVFADCGLANAFYVPAANTAEIDGQGIAGDIFMCHELTALFANVFGNNDQAFLASTFVLMHELGHALVDVLGLPVLGIEESYVDGVAAVFLGESGLSEGSVLAGWFFGSQPNTPFFDSHRAGLQRLGDLACWGVGADMSLLSDPTTSNIAAQLIEVGRNCESEYAQQLSGFSELLGPFIQGGFDVLADNGR